MIRKKNLRSSKRKKGVLRRDKVSLFNFCEKKSFALREGTLSILSTEMLEGKGRNGISSKTENVRKKRTDHPFPMRI